MKLNLIGRRMRGTEPHLISADPFNQNDDDQVDAGEPNAPDQENPNDDANMVSDDDADDDDSFVQKVESKRFLSRANATK